MVFCLFIIIKYSIKYIVVVRWFSLLARVTARARAAARSAADMLSIVGRSLLRDGTPVEIRGVNYSPLKSYTERFASPPDITSGVPHLDVRFTEASRTVWARDLPAIAATGANTVRLYNWDPTLHTTDLSFLDACSKLGLSVILPISNWFLDFPERAAPIVRQTSRHPALLMWGVSNEAPTQDVNGQPQAYYYERIAALANVVRQTEDALGTWHPITVPVTSDLAHMNWLHLARVPIDIWGFNCYWAATESYPADWFAQFKAKSKGKPLVITEFGMDSYDNRVDQPFERVQAEYTAAQWTSLFSPRGSGGLSLGGVIFEWMDEPWKAAAFENRPEPTQCVPRRGGVHAGWAPLARPTGYAADAFPDRCGNDAFFGMVELLPNDTIRKKLIASPSGPLAQAWASPSAGGLSSLALVGGVEAATAPHYSDFAARSALALTVLVLGAAVFAAQVLARRRQQASSSPETRWPAAQEPLQPAQEGDDLEYRLM